MSQADTGNTMNAPAPTTTEMDDMWLARRRDEEAEADRRYAEIVRRLVHSWLHGEDGQ